MLAGAILRRHKTFHFMKPILFVILAAVAVALTGCSVPVSPAMFMVENEQIATDGC